MGGRGEGEVRLRASASALEREVAEKCVNPFLRDPRNGEERRALPVLLRYPRELVPILYEVRR